MESYDFLGEADLGAISPDKVLQLGQYETQKHAFMLETAKTIAEQKIQRDTLAQRKAELDVQQQDMEVKNRIEIFQTLLDTRIKREDQRLTKLRDQANERYMKSMADRQDVETTKLKKELEILDEELAVLEKFSQRTLDVPNFGKMSALEYIILAKQGLKPPLSPDTKFEGMWTLPDGSHSALIIKNGIVDVQDVPKLPVDSKPVPVRQENIAQDTETRINATTQAKLGTSEWYEGFGKMFMNDPGNVRLKMINTPAAKTKAKESYDATLKRHMLADYNESKGKAITMSDVVIVETETKGKKPGIYFTWDNPDGTVGYDRFDYIPFDEFMKP